MPLLNIHVSYFAHSCLLLGLIQMTPSFFPTLLIQAFKMRRSVVCFGAPASSAIAAASLSVPVPWERDGVSLSDPSSSASSRQAGLTYLLERIKLQMIPFNAQDLYQICGTLYHSDTLGMMRDEEVMRAFAAAFARADQRVLSPFQVTLILDTLRKAGISSAAHEVAVPETEAISPESLLNALRAMRASKVRDEKKLLLLGEAMVTILEEYTATQLVDTLTELSRLRFSNVQVVNALLRRALSAFAEELGPEEVSTLLRAVAPAKGLSPLLVRQVMTLVEKHAAQFQMEDYQNALHALLRLGDSHGKTLRTLVVCGLEEVENMDASTLTLFLRCFASMRYPTRAHVEIYADALVDVSTDLAEREVVEAFVALHHLQLLSENLFTSMLLPLQRYAPMMSQQHLAPVMDVCSASPYNSDALMQPLLMRVAECLRLLTPNQLADVLDIVGLYPPARQQHDFIQMAGQQARFRMEIMAPEALAKATRGLAHLGYRDPEFYLFAVDTGFRFGFPSWAALEPVIMGVALSPDACPISVLKRLASYAAPLCRSMTLADVQRANHYFMALRCEEEYLYRALATRTLQFVKEVTTDTPEELRLLLQRTAVTSIAPPPHS